MSNEFAYRLSQVFTTGFFATLSDAVLKGTGLLLAACLLQLLLRRRAAALRHAIWTTTLGLLLVLPVLSAALPGWRVLPDWLRTDWDDQPAVPGTTVIDTSVSPALSVSPGNENGGSAEIARPDFIVPSGGEELSEHVISTASAGQMLPESMNAVQAPVEVAAQRSRAAAIRSGILAAWLLGLAACVLRMALSAWALCRCRWRANQVVTGPLSQEFFQLGSELGLRRMPRLLLGDGRAMPMAWGVLRSCVLVPRDIEQWPVSQRRAVLLHELGHIVRRDPLWQLLVQVAQAVYWFHPLVWLAVWRVHVERERACDDLVLNRGVAAPDYARHLLDVVSTGRLRRIGPAIGVAMASSRKLEGRVRSIMDGGRDRRPLTTRLLVLSIVGCLAIGLPLAMMQGADPADGGTAEPPSVDAAATDAAQPKSPEQITQRVRELIYVIRQSRIFSRDDEWTGAIRELIEIGKPALPELIAELDRTDRDQTLRALGFTLRGIGDPGAVPALIRNLPKALRPPGSDCGLYIRDLELRAFLQAHQRHKGKEEYVSWGRPVNEMLDAIVVLTGHDVAKNPDNDELRHVMRSGNPVQQAGQLQQYVDRQRLWEAWWSEHGQELTTKAELKALDVARPAGDPVEAAGLAKFGPLFPTGPDVRLGPVREIILDNNNYWDAASHVDFDSGRTFQNLEGAEQVRGGPPGDSRYLFSNWPVTMGIDVRGREARDLHFWLIDDSRWSTIEEEVRRQEHLELGVEGNHFLAPRSNGEFQDNEPGTFLFTTREGGRGIVQSFPRDKLTGTYRFRYRMWAAEGAADQNAGAVPLRAPIGPPLGPIVTVAVQTPGRGRSFLLDLEQNKSITPPDTLIPDYDDKKLYIANNQPLTEWCREQGIDIASYVASVESESGGEAGAARRAVQLIGIGMIVRRVLPTAFDEMGTGDVQEIIARWPESNGFDWMSPHADLPHQPDTFVIRTRSGRIGLLRLRETADDLSSITIQYRLGAAPPGNIDAPGPAPREVKPREPESSSDRPSVDQLRSALNGAGANIELDANGQVDRIELGFRVTDGFLGRIAEMSSPRRLRLNGNKMTDVTARGIAALGQLQRLEELRINRIPLGDLNFEPLSQLNRLEVLWLEECQIDDDDLRLIGELQSLRVLKIPGNRISDAGLPHMAGLAGLEELDVSNTAANETTMRVSDAGLAALVALKNLRKLVLKSAATGHTLPITNDGLQHLTALPVLTSLDLEGLDVNDTGLRHLGACGNLAELSIFSRTMTDDGLAQLVKCRNLKSLKLGAGMVTDDGMAVITNLQPLESLRISGRQLTHRSVAHFAKLPKLKDLSLRMSGVNDEALASLAVQKSLESLEITGQDFTAAGLQRLQELPNLSQLTLNSLIAMSAVVPFGPAREPPPRPDADTARLNSLLAVLKGFRQLKSLRGMYTGFTDDEYAELQLALPGADVRGTESPTPGSGAAVSQFPTKEALQRAAQRAKDSQARISQPAEDNTEQDTGNYVFPIDVSGRALDANGKPIAGAVIFLGSQRVDWKRLSETTTDEQGRYVFLQVPLPIERASTNNGKDVGAFEVFGFADGFAIAWRPMKWFYPDPNAIDRSVVIEGEQDLPREFAAGDKIELDQTFERPVSFSGRIVDDRGRPIPETDLDIRYADTEWDRPDYNIVQFRGALQSLNERETVPTEFKRRKTDADGRFTYTGLRPDCRYSIWVRPPGFPLKRIWAVTHPGKSQDDNGLPIYGDGMELTFATPVDLRLKVVYDDTGEPAPKVYVSIGQPGASASQTSDAEGLATLRVPPGESKLHLNPAHGTPYLVSDQEVDVPATPPEQPRVVRLSRGCEVEVTVVGAVTGAGVPNVDLWHEAEYPRTNGRPPLQQREIYSFRSWEVETRIAHVNRPRTDADGHLWAVFPPGKHRIGVGLESYPPGSRIVESDGQEIKCKAGETVKVTFHLQRN